MTDSDDDRDYWYGDRLCKLCSKTFIAQNQYLYCPYCLHKNGGN